MKFKLKKSLIGVAALSLIAPVASHAVNDGFNRAAKDGRGSTCVATGSPDKAVDAAACAEASKEATAATQADAAARKAAQAEAAAAAQAAREQAVMAVEPGSALKAGEKGAYVSHGSSAPIRDGFGRSCVKDGRWNPAMATEECDPDLHNLYRSKSAAKPNQELAPRLAAEPPEAVRDTSTQLQQSDLAPRISAPPPERVVAPAAAAAVGAAAATGAAVAASKAPAPATDNGDEIAAFVAPPGADDEDEAEDVLAQELADDDEVTPEMMLSDADRTLSADDDATLLAAVPLMDDDDADEVDEDRLEELAEDDEVTPDMMLSEADRTLAGDEEGTVVAALADDDDDDDYDDGPAHDDGEDEDTTPDMMLAEDERRLDDEDIGMLAAVPVDDEDDGTKNLDDDDDDETTPEMMLSDADRTLEGEEISPGVATLTDTSPGEVPPPEKVVEHKPVIDNNLPVFPENKQQVADAKPASKPASLPVTIDVKEDGLFDFDRYVLKSETISKLDAVADMLRDSKYDAINIVGHADPIGSEGYNQGLSQRRAEAAKKYLVGKGIDPSRIQTSARGETDLVVARADCSGLRKQALIDCLQPNRRVVVEAAGTR